MNADDHIPDLLPDIPEFGDVHDVLVKIARLDRDRFGNLGKLLSLYSQLAAILRHGPREVTDYARLREWVKDYGQVLEEAQIEIQYKFGVELEAEMRIQGVALTGNYPLLKAGLFTLEIDFSRYRVTLWYGPKQERLTTLPVVPSRVAKKLGLVRSQLGGQIGCDYFSGMLEGAYRSCSGGLYSVVVPLRDVVDRFDRPGKVDRGAPGSRRISRADLSYNLFRFSESLMKDGLRLTVASRSFTRHKKDFLWIPDSHSSTGSYYSHIEFRRTS